EVIAPTTFKANLISRRFGTLLHEVATADSGFDSVVVLASDRAGEVSEQTGSSIAIDEVIVLAGPGALETTPAPRPSRNHTSRALERVGLIHRQPTHAIPSKYRLENFIVGESNRLAYDAAMRIAEGDLDDQGAARSQAVTRRAGRGWGPLFLHGPCG